MKLVAKCSAFISLSDKVHVKVCNPIPVRYYILPFVFLKSLCLIYLTPCLIVSYRYEY